jgi:hypothetical protein
MVMLCGLRYDQAIKKQSKPLLVAMMKRTARHPAALNAVQT